MESTKRCIIFDLDGTLRDLTHRLHHIQGPHKDYDAFHAKVIDDKPKKDIIELFGICERANIQNCYEIFIFSGCSEIAREDTDKWLRDALPSYYWYNRLWMRPEGDYTPDYELKRAWLNEIREEGYEVIFTVDDRQSVVDMWREEGITCLQVEQWEEDNHDSYIDYSTAHLNVLVGPSGAGKSRFAMRSPLFPKRHGTYLIPIIISTDDIRVQLTGDFKDQSKNDQVFTIYHKDIKHHLECGRVVYADATNLHAKDRKKLLSLLPKGVTATYHIIDRPLEDKLRDGGWRNDVFIEKAGKWLIEYHHDKFQSGVKYALEGDGDERVTVVDHRDFRYEI